MKQSNKVCMKKDGSAASHHYWCDQDIMHLTNITNDNCTQVQLPNDQYINSTQKGELPLLQELPKKAKTAIILPKLKNASLISIGHRDGL